MKLVICRETAPYIGCFHENCYFVIDDDGSVITTSAAKYNVQSMDGIVLEEHLDILKEIEIDPENEINAMELQLPESHIPSLLAFQTELPENIFYVECVECGCKIYSDDDLHYVSYHGCGGLHVEPDTPVCSNCYASGRCDICGEYVGSDELIHLVPGVNTISERTELLACEFCAREQGGYTESPNEGLCPICRGRVEVRDVDEEDEMVKLSCSHIVSLKSWNEFNEVNELDDIPIPLDEKCEVCGARSHGGLDHFMDSVRL